MEWNFSADTTSPGLPPIEQPLWIQGCQAVQLQVQNGHSLAGIRSSLVASGRARAHQEAQSFSPDKGNSAAQCPHLKPTKMSQATLPRNSCNLRGVLASRRVGDSRVHLGVVKNLLWSIQVWMTSKSTQREEDTSN